MVSYRISFVIWSLLSLHVSTQSWNLFDNKTKGPPQDGGLRLVGGNQPNKGRVEVYHNGKWGTVCDDNWTLNEAQVVCQQLGFPGAVSASSGGTYGEGSGPIWLDDLSCMGSESFLSSCKFKGWGVTDCSHKEDAGVVCESAKYTDNYKFQLDHSLGLSEDLGTLFDSGDNCDFSIVVRDPSDDQAEQNTVCVHRLILSLYPQFNISDSMKDLTVEIDQNCHPHISSFLRYLYTRKIDITLSSAQCLHQLSYIYQLQQLLEEIGKIFTLLLIQDGSFRTQVSLYEYGVRTKDMLLQENVLQYLSWNFEFFVDSPAWKTVSIHLMKELLSRSDIVVKNEFFVLQVLEASVKEKGETVSLEDKVSLLSSIRFPMIPVENLYDIQFSSGMYQSNEAFYSSALLKGFQFNTLPFSKIKDHFKNIEEYLPRIYTAEQWSTVINYTSNSQANIYYPSRHYPYGNFPSVSFMTPAHNSVTYKEQKISWIAQIFKNSWECSNQGFICDSLPLARLYTQYGLSNYKNTIRFNNKLILSCKSENIVFNVQDFKSDKAVLPTNSSMVLPHPCPDDYSFKFVVSPEYI
ncbi:galectin-3-binding protein A isoform X1 [Tachysurus fulvidraco]|uniref:galectin-3-binding protein A isoform X1 n=1 Tax=Tachysurus fulvidraco TaxID=1234273 RepID=UPI000F4DB3D9|nr:galectin-3-binding protein A isoform X1 [Tachysurus fulvidraco]